MTLLIFRLESEDFCFAVFAFVVRSTISSNTILGELLLPVWHENTSVGWSNA
jgi:hypothetical protein